jgi:hypothetical protein
MCVILHNINPKTGSGVIFTIPDKDLFSTTLVSHGRSVKY